MARGVGRSGADWEIHLLPAGNEGTAGSEADVGRLLRDVGLAARPRYDRVGGHGVVG